MKVDHNECDNKICPSFIPIVPSSYLHEIILVTSDVPEDA